MNSCCVVRFHWLLVAPKLLTSKLHSKLDLKESDSEILERSDILPPTPQPWFQPLSVLKTKPSAQASKRRQRQHTSEPNSSSQKMPPPLGTSKPAQVGTSRQQPEQCFFLTGNLAEVPEVVGSHELLRRFVHEVDVEVPTRKRVAIDPGSVNVSDNSGFCLFETCR